MVGEHGVKNSKLQDQVKGGGEWWILNSSPYIVATERKSQRRERHTDTRGRGWVRGFWDEKEVFVM